MVKEKEFLLLGLLKCLAKEVCAMRIEQRRYLKNRGSAESKQAKHWQRTVDRTLGHIEQLENGCLFSFESRTPDDEGVRDSD